VPTYFAARWDHDREDEPVVLYEELDDQRQETRKVHEYSDGHLERTDRVALELRTSLSPAQVPSEAEIDADPVFTLLPLTAAEFQAVWDRATDAR
jgi:hypothetical protein